MRCGRSARNGRCFARRVQGALAANLEAVDLLKRLKQGFLHEVLCVGDVARRARQAARGPAPQARQVACQQRVEGRAIAGLRPRQQGQRRPASPGRFSIDETGGPAS
jgi:hypothetical protein